MAWRLHRTCTHLLDTCSHLATAYNAQQSANATEADVALQRAGKVCTRSLQVHPFFLRVPDLQMLPSVNMEVDCGFLLFGSSAPGSTSCLKSPYVWGAACVPREKLRRMEAPPPARLLLREGP